MKKKKVPPVKNALKVNKSMSHPLILTEKALQGHSGWSRATPGSGCKVLYRDHFRGAVGNGGPVWEAAWAEITFRSALLARDRNRMQKSNSTMMWKASGHGYAFQCVSDCPYLKPEWDLCGTLI